MSVGYPTITVIGTSNSSSASAATVIGTAGFPTNTQIGDLVICAIYERGGNVSTTPPRDTSDGWLFLDYVYSVTNGFGMILGAWLCTFENKADMVGITLPSTTSHMYAMTTFRIASGFNFVPARSAGSMNLTAAFTATASSVTQLAQVIAQPYAQCLDVVARGYGATGAGVTVADITGFTETFDGGQASPPMGLVLNYRTVDNHNINPVVSSSASAAKINRAGLRAMIPIVAKTSYNHRYMSSRRIA